MKFLHCSLRPSKPMHNFQLALQKIRAALERQFDTLALIFNYMNDGEVKLEKYSIGVGDRFAHQAEAQLRACMLASNQGAEVIPVWNKSNREHLIVGSEPASVHSAAAAAVKKLG